LQRSWPKAPLLIRGHFYSRIFLFADFFIRRFSYSQNFTQAAAVPHENFSFLTTDLRDFSRSAIFRFGPTPNSETLLLRLD
jgi:hypothetical protein